MARRRNAARRCGQTVIDEGKRLVLIQLIIMAVALVTAMVMIAFPLLAVIRMGMLVVTSQVTKSEDNEDTTQ